MTLKSRCNWLVLLLLVNGMLIEVNNAYKQAMDISNIVMPAAPILHLPRAWHHAPLSEMPMVHQFDRMTLTSEDMAWSD